MPIMGFGAENEMMHFVGVLVTPVFLVLELSLANEKRAEVIRLAFIVEAFQNRRVSPCFPPLLWQSLESPVETEELEDGRASVSWLSE